jgi:hypothetical protein
VLDRTGTILLSLFTFAPILFLGLLMLTDPDCLVVSLRSLAGALRTIEQRLRGSYWPEPLSDANAGRVSASARLTSRFAGLALVLYTIAALADALHV